MAMNNTLNDMLNRLAHRTHSPRGQYAATEQTYQSLLGRIPVEQRPVIGRQRTIFPRWSAAACLWLVVGIGLAIAGVWYHQYHLTPSAADDTTTSEPPATNEAIRTLVYEQVPLGNIAAELSEIFRTPIQIIDPALRDYCITATFSTDEPLDEILSVLAEIGKFEVHRTTDTIILEKRAD